MQVNAYLNFNGQCEEAFKFYEKCLGGKVLAMFTHRGTPMEAQTPPEWLDKIMHIRMEAAGGILMGSDAPPNRYETPRGFSVTIGLSDATEAERIFHAMSEGGTVSLPIQQTFWALRFAMFVDQFGIPWMINCEQAAA